MIELRWYKMAQYFNGCIKFDKPVLQMRQESNVMTPVINNGDIIGVESVSGWSEWQDIPVVEEE